MRLTTSRLCSTDSTEMFAAAGSKYRRALILLCICAVSSGILALHIFTSHVKQSFALNDGTKQSSGASMTGMAPSASDETRAASQPSRPEQSGRAELLETYGKLPLSFEANRGQTSAEVKFYSRGEGYGLFLTSTGATLNLSRTVKKKPAVHKAKPEATTDETASRQAAIVRMKLVGADPSAEVSGADELPGKVNYFIGHDSQKWRTDIPTFAKVRYRNVYRGVDLVYYGNQQQLEYDFVVTPGTDPSAITLGYEGIQKAEIEANGDLTLHTGGGVVRQHRPQVYQLIGGTRRGVDSHYILKSDHEVGFAVAQYDAGEPLVIDPVLVYSTYFGGRYSDDTFGIAVDADGNAYVTGSTYSNDFPITPGAFQTQTVGITTNTALKDAYVLKLNKAGNGVVYSTFLGGKTDNDEARRIGASSADTLIIGGRVTDGGNGIGKVMLRLSGSLTGTQWSDDQGKYSFGNLAADGDYTVDVSSPYYDFSPSSQSFHHLSVNQTANFAGTMRHFSISGRISDTSGTGIAAVTVSLSGAQTATTQTDNDGNYTFGNLPATGAYEVLPSKAHYFFDPGAQNFISLPGDQTANFKAFLFYTISGRVVNTYNGKGISRLRINLTGTQNVYALTDDDGKYYFSPLISGGNFTVTPQFPDYVYTPPSYSFTNLNSDQKTNFSATSLYGIISGRMTDENGKGVFDAVVVLDGQQNLASHTDSNGNFSFYTLPKGTSHTLTASKIGYTISPSSLKVTIETDENNANFLGLVNQPRPFTSGGILVSCANILSEYTADGKLVQASPIPYPNSSPYTQQYTGDIVLDQNGEVEIYNGDYNPYLTSYDFKQSAWRHHAYEDWDTLGYNLQSGIAAYANYIFVTDRGLSQPPGKGGILRINLNDFSSQRFATTLEFQDLNIGLDGLLYGLTDSQQIYVYQPLSMASVRTINLDSSIAFAVKSIAVNGAGHIFGGTYNGYFYHFNPDGAVLKSLSVGPIGENVGDIEVSSGGQVVAGNNYGRLFLTDESLSNLTSFAVGHSASFVAFTNTVPSQTSSLKFGAVNYTVDEGAGSATITVTREGDLSGPASVNYLTTDESAHQRSDYTLASGTLNFAPGESSQRFNVLITDNAYVDGPRALNLVLRNSKNAPVLNPATAALTITDNDTAAPTLNPIDDAQAFVRQQYADFLNRAPDDGGLGYWTGEISKCGSDAVCIHDRRVGVADAFFFEDEFQKTGAYIYRVYKTGLGQRPTFSQFMADRGLVVSGSQLDASKTAYALAFAQRDAFLQLYPRSQTATQFVTALLSSIQQRSGVDLSAQSSTLQNLYDGTDNGRAAIIRQVADNQAVIDAEYNQSFVLMEYFGYLRRDPDPGGFDFWLGQVNKFPLRNVGIQHAMACSFITSAEYQTRFSSIVTHNNTECPQ